MAIKERKSNPTNVNTNNNTNNVHVNLKVEQKKTRTYSKKPKSNWITRLVIGGLITIAISIIGYFLQQSGNNDVQRNSTSITPNGEPLQGQKQN